MDTDEEVQMFTIEFDFVLHRSVYHTAFSAATVVASSALVLPPAIHLSLQSVPMLTKTSNDAVFVLVCRDRHNNHPYVTQLRFRCKPGIHYKVMIHHSKYRHFIAVNNSVSFFPGVLPVDGLLVPRSLHLNTNIEAFSTATNVKLYLQTRPSVGELLLSYQTERTHTLQDNSTAPLVEARVSPAGVCFDPQKGSLWRLAALVPGHRSATKTIATKFMSISLWINADILVSTQMAGGSEHCLFTLKESRMKISYFTPGCIDGRGSRFRFTIRDDSGQPLDLDLFYRVLPGRWQNLIVSFSSETYFFMALDGHTVSFYESTVPSTIQAPRQGEMLCSDCENNYKPFPGQVGSIYYSTSAPITPAKIHTSLASIGTHPTASLALYSSARTMPADTTVVYYSRTHLEVVETFVWDALMSLCENTPPETLLRIKEIVVLGNRPKENPHDMSVCSTLPIRFTVPSDLRSWRSVLKEGYAAARSTKNVIFVDSHVTLTSTSVNGLLHGLDSTSMTIISSVVLDHSLRLHITGYNFAWQPAMEGDFVLPVQYLRGYPVSYPGVGQLGPTSIVSGHAFAVHVSDLNHVVQSYQPFADVDVDVPPSLFDSDFFLHCKKIGVGLKFASNTTCLFCPRSEDDLLSDPSLYMEAVTLFNDTWGAPLAARIREQWELDVGVRWLMHCAGSMGVEAMWMLNALQHRMPTRSQVVRPIPFCEHGDANIRTGPRGILESYARLSGLGPMATTEIVIYHRDYRSLGEVTRGLESAYTIGRYMFEGNGSLHQALLAQVQHLDEVWVPSAFHKDVMVANHVPREKIIVIPEAIDATLMIQTAARYSPLDVYGVRVSDFKFLSVFKLEDRKGWQQLVEGYCRAFTSAQNVSLLLHTYIYNAGDPWSVPAMMKLINDHLNVVQCKDQDVSLRPRIGLTGEALTNEDIIRLYKAADVYVSAHWGEGWSLPLAEAMALGIPAIATDFSGNTGFMTPENSFLVPINKSVPYSISDEWFGGMEHAVIDVSKLSETLQFVFTHFEEAQAKGRLGQIDMMTTFSPDAVASTIINRIRSIQASLSARPKAAHMRSLESTRVLRGFLDTPETRVCQSPFVPRQTRVRKMLSHRPRRVVIISTYSPRKCGIATFAKNLVDGMRRADASVHVEVIAMTTDLDHLQYPAIVTRTIRMNMLDDYFAAAAYINANDFDRVFLQHEFGIFGPTYGGYIICLMKSVSVPIVATVHTVLTRLNDQEGSTLQLVAQLSARTVAMAEVVRKRLETSFIVSEHVAVIPHGAPDVTPNPAERLSMRAQLNWTSRFVVFANGLIHTEKGYEYMIWAMPKVLRAVPNALFCICGAPHQNNPGNQAYYDGLQRLVTKSNLSASVVFFDEFLAFDTLTSMLAAADVFVAPYTDDGVSTSGTVTMAMSVGLPTVGTPFLFAKDALRNTRGVLVRFRDKDSLATGIVKLATNAKLRASIGDNARQFMQQRTWEIIGGKYLDIRVASLPASDNSSVISLRNHS